MDSQNVQMIDATSDFYEDIKELCDVSFGTGYLDRTEYDKWLSHPRLVNIALVDDEFAGFSAMIGASTEAVMEHMDMERSEVLAITGGKPALIYKSVAVSSKFRKNGLLTRLIEGLLEHVKELGYGAVFLSAWMYDGKIPTESSLMSLGFTRLYQRHMLWYRYENYHCVVCNGRCVCDAVIFYKNLAADGEEETKS